MQAAGAVHATPPSPASTPGLGTETIRHDRPFQACATSLPGSVAAVRWPTARQCAGSAQETPDKLISACPAGAILPCGPAAAAAGITGAAASPATTIPIMLSLRNIATSGN